MMLVWPAHEYLASYVAALERGWSPDDLRPEATQEELARIAAGADAFLASLVDRVGLGDIALPDGTVVPRLPGYSKWMWDGEFCGRINFRWDPGTEALPRIVSATSAMPSSLGSSGAATRLRRCARC